MTAKGYKDRVRPWKRRVGRGCAGLIGLVVLAAIAGVLLLRSVVGSAANFASAWPAGPAVFFAAAARAPRLISLCRVGH